MRILLDTNILIPLEATEKELSSDLAALKRQASRLGVTYCVHPAQKSDIGRDSDIVRRRIMLSRIEQYEEIVSPPPLTTEVAQRLGWPLSKPNDLVDNQLLYSLSQGAVHALVTEDADIHRRARRIGLSDQVYNIVQAVQFLKKMLGDEVVQVPFGLREVPLHHISVEQDFFQSLRDSYDGFNDWYKKAATEQRRCWCVVDEDNVTVKAICIYKIENQIEISQGATSMHGRFLKLCTLKVDPSIRGMKIGERLLFASMKRAYQEKCDGIFVHTQESMQRPLVGLLEDFGFLRIGMYEGDAVYLKNAIPSPEYGESSPLQFVKRFYPHYIADDRVAKYIVPIQPQFHERLFPDESTLSDGLFKENQYLLSPCGNAIKKAYICNSNTRQVAEGDLLLFYRSIDRRSVQVCGVVERVVRTIDTDLALTIVSKRTVYTRDEVGGLTAKNGGALILLFRYIVPELVVNQLDLQNAGVEGPIQTIRRISNDQYRMLLKVTK